MNPTVPLVDKPKKGDIRHILIKLSNVTDKEFWKQQAKRSDKGTPIKLLVDFSIETFQSRSQLDDTVKILKEKKLSTKNSTLTKCLWHTIL